VKLTDNSNNITEGTAAANTLLNVDNTISGAGKIGNGQMTLINAAKGVINANGASNSLAIDTGSNVIQNAGTIAATAATTLSIESPIVNSGTLKAAAAGALVLASQPVTNNGQLVAALGTIAVAGAISGSGTATIDFGGVLDFGGVGINQNVTFANIGTGKATLEFDASPTANPNLIYNGVISGFSSSQDRIDLEALAFNGNTSVTKTLQGGNTVIEVTESGKVVDLTLAGNRMASHFVVSTDGASGTLIVDPPAAPALDLLPLVHAISSFAPSVLAGSPVAALVVGLSEPSMLAAGGHHG
jgi:large repetitive protein